MTERLKKSWTLLPAAAILYFGIQHFLEKLPPASARSAVRGPVSENSDTLLLRFAREFRNHGDTAGQFAPMDNPFHGVRLPPAPGTSAAKPKPEPPQRKLVLKGTVGSEVATITGRTGISRIVRIGDDIDSATVISISANRVTLKDRAGKFELTADK